MANVPGPKPSLRTQWLGARLRDLRKVNKFSLRDAGEFLTREASTIGRYEAGEFPIRRGDLLGLMTLYGVSEESERSELLELCDEAWRKGWWDQHRNDLGSHFINVPWLESRATTAKAFEHKLINGLLQTPDYAETVITAVSEPGTSQDQIRRWVNLRMERKLVLQRQEQFQFTCIFEESVLQRPVGSDALMQAQLESLLDLCELPNIEIQVVPTSIGPHAAFPGAFVLYTMPSPYPSVAHAETLGGTVYVEEPKLQKFQIAWNDIQDKALTPHQSSDLIANQLKEY